MNWNIQIEGLDTLTDVEYQALRESLKMFVAVSHEHKRHYSDDYISECIKKSSLFTDEERKDHATIILNNPTAQRECYQFLEKKYPLLHFWDEEDAGPSFYGDTHGGPRSQITNYRNKPFLHSVHNGQ